MELRRPKSLKIVFVLNIPTPYRDPLLDLIGKLEGIDLTVLYCSESDPMRTWQLRKGGHEALYLSGASVGGKRGGLRWRLNPKVGATLSRLRPSLVVVGGYINPTMQLAMTWCHRENVPFLLLSESHDCRTHTSELREKIKGVVIRRAVKRARGFLAASPLATNYLIRWGAPPDRVFLFPNAPDREGLRSKALEARSQAKKFRSLGSPLLLFVGRLIPIKNVQTLLRAFRTVKLARPNARLLIAGSGPEERKLKRLGHASLDGVTFLGFVSQHDLPVLYSAADLLLLPSLYETFGVVVLESLVLGTPVIISENVGAKDLIKEGINGFVLPSLDPDIWAQTIMEATDPPNLQHLNQGLEMIGNPWDYDLCLDNFRSAIESAMQNGTSSPQNGSDTSAWE